MNIFTVYYIFFTSTLGLLNKEFGSLLSHHIKFGNSMGLFSQESFLMPLTHAPKQVSFIFAPPRSNCETKGQI